MMRYLDDHRTRRLITLAAVLLYFCIDVMEMLFESEGGEEEEPFEFHHLFLFVAMGLAFWSFVKEMRMIETLEGQLSGEQEKNQRLSHELSNHINERFSEWALTEAEKDVAWLLIKGFSFVEIAQLRDVKEKTLRQQASQIYSKAGLRGRSELSAAFLEDLLDTRR